MVRGVQREQHRHARQASAVPARRHNIRHDRVFIYPICFQQAPYRTAFALIVMVEKKRLLIIELLMPFQYRFSNYAFFFHYFHYTYIFVYFVDEDFHYYY
jgi:hypothetical protein